MKIHFLSIVVILFSHFTGLGQTERIEKQLMDCYYQSYPDDGEGYKQLLFDYQNLLIREGFLIDESGKSYIQLLKGMVNGTHPKKEPSKLFCLESQKLRGFDPQMTIVCNQIKSADSTNYNKSMVKQIEQFAFDSPKSLARKMLELLSKEDFTLDYYKRLSFLVFCMLDTQAGINEDFQEVKDYDPDMALHIRVTEKDEVYVDHNQVSKEKLAGYIEQHALRNKSEATFVLAYNGKTTYSVYRNTVDIVYNTVSDLREKLSLEKFGASFEDLDDSLRKQITAIYPLRIVEEELE